AIAPARQPRTSQIQRFRAPILSGPCWMQHLQLRLHRNRQPPDTFPDLLRMTIARIERISRNEGDILIKSRPEQPFAIYAFRQSHPEKQAAFGVSPRRLGREEFAERLKHDIAPLAIDAPDTAHVLVEEAVARNFVSHVLSESGRVQVSTLLQLNELADDIGRRDDPTEPDARGKSLGESAEINNVADQIFLVAAQVLAVDNDQRRQVFAFISQLPVRIILHDRDAIFVSQ